MNKPNSNPRINLNDCFHYVMAFVMTIFRARDRCSNTHILPALIVFLKG